MPVFHWLKDSFFYPRLRVAAASLLGAPRFYGPASALALFEADRGKPSPELVQRGWTENGLTIWRTPLGELAAMDTGIALHVACLVSEFQRSQYVRPPLQLKLGDTVLDIGANIGLFALQALKVGARQVVCVEPAPGNLAALRWNLASGISCGKVLIVAKGAWDVAGAMLMRIDPCLPVESSIVDPPRGEDAYDVPIDVEPLDLVVETLRLPRVDFIKMDVEGAEIGALRGAAGILRRFKPQLSIAVEHTPDRLRNAGQVRDLVLSINPAYRCTAGPYTVTRDRRLAPDVLYFH
jgi:FkbM family methyltransferase